MALSDIYMLTHVEAWNNTEEMQNVYFYRKSDPGGSAPDLIQAWTADVRDAVLGIQTDAVYQRRIDCINLGDLTDFATTSATLQGYYTSAQALPAHSAVQFTLRANSRAVRPGSKRYSGIPETAQSNGTITDATYITALNALRTALAATIQDSGGEPTYVPVIVKRVLYHPEVGVDAYRLPQSNAELVTADITSALLNLQISHQTSRGNGR